MKKRFQKVFAFLGIFALIFSNPATILYVDALSAADAKESVEVGGLENEGDIHIEKTATPTEIPGRYKITFKIKGVPYQKTYPLYAVVVFDRSGSMICNPDKGYAETTNSSNPHFRAKDGQGIYCYNENGTPRNYWDDYLDSSLVTADKWNNAISGAQTFKSTINENLGDSAHVSLVTFANDVSTATNSFEDAIRNAISIGGDSDTIGCITGSIAEAFYEVSNDHDEYGYRYWPCDLFFMDLDGIWTDSDSERYRIRQVHGVCP